jgi:hypothetical protein
MDGNNRAQRRVSRRTAVQSVGGAVLGGAALTAVTTGAVGTAAAAAESPPIIGTWLLTTPGQARRDAALLFFHGDGIVQYVGAPLRSTHAPGDPEETTEHQTLNGEQWLRTGFNEYSFRLVGIDYDARGTPILMDTIQGTATHDPLRDQCTVAISL